MQAAAYITLEEAAELEGIEYFTLYRRIERNKKKYSIQPQKSDTGGRDIVLVSVKSLSKMAQAAFERREAVKRIADAADQDVEAAEEPAPERPWYVDADYEWYQHQYQKNYYKAMELGNVVREYISNVPKHHKDLTVWTEEYAKERTGKSGRTFRRMVDDYMTASAWADRMQKEDGCGYDYIKVLALCRKPKEVGQFPSIPPVMKQCIKNIWFDKSFAQNRRTREDLYETLQEIAEVKGWEKLPSYQTVSRYIVYLMDVEGMASAHAYAKNGAVAWKNRQMVKRARDTKSLQVLEMVQGDEHTFDLWVLYKTPSGKEIPIRPKLVCWIDTRSRMIFGDVICRDANAQILKESLIKMFYEDLNGYVPKYLYIDNGKDYTSKDLNGIDRKDRHDAEAKEKYFDMECDRKTRGFYRDMGISDVHISMPYEPWTKGQIERSFGTAIQKFSKQFASYTGTLTGSKTDAKVNKDIKAMAERGELLTMEEFYEKWKEYKEKYINRQHSSLKRMQEEYKTPKALFENGERYQKPAPARSVAVMALMKAEEAYVYNTGIRRSGYDYMAYDLCSYIGRKVQIKVDPWDVTGIYVMDDTGALICRAEAQELLKFGRVSDPVLQDHRRMQNRQIRDVREQLEEATRPFDLGEVTENYGKGMVGGVELTIGKKPERAQKVVQMPEDKHAVRNARKARQEKETSEYMKSQAQKALERLRAMGEK